MSAVSLLRKAWHNLRRDASSNLVAIVAMALGIGSVTAMFSVTNAVVLRSLPFADPARLFELRVVAGSRDSGIASGDFDTLRSVPGIISSTLVSPGAVTLTGSEGAENVFSEKLAGDGLSVYGVAPQIGRLPPTSVEQSVVISHRLWQRRFGGNPNITGRRITVNGDACTIAAVMPARFSAGNRADLWTFWRFAEEDHKRHGEAMSNFILRLRPGATPEGVTSLLDTVAREQQPPRYARLKLRLQSVSDRIIGTPGATLWTLSGAVGLVLLVACMNAGSLLAVRGLARRRETAVRTALGAGRWQLIRPVLGEAATLAFVATLAGSALAWAMVAALKRLLAPSLSLPLPRLDQSSIDGAALAVAVAAAFVSIFLASAAPALAALRVQPAMAFGDGSRSASVGRSTIRFGMAATAGQTALSVILLVGAGLLLRSVVHLIEQDPGYQREGILTARIPMPFDVRQRYGSQAEYEHYRSVLETVRTLPGVQSAAVTTVLPLGRVAAAVDFVPEGQSAPKEPYYVQAYGITPDYFRVMGIPLRVGRWFDDRDKVDAPPVVVINDVTARRYWPGQDPVGKRVKGNIPMVVVGVVGGVRRGSMRDAPREEIYRPLPQFLFALHGSTLVLRTVPGVSPTLLAQPVRALLTDRFPNFPVAEVRLMSGWIEDSVAASRLYAVLLGSFAGQALLIASAGLYGLLAHTATLRRREVGIRLAMGARPFQVASLFLRHGLTIVLLGVAAGSGGGVILADLLRSQLYGVQPTDPTTLSIVVLTFVTVAVGSMLLPALRASRVDPTHLLRAE